MILGAVAMNTQIVGLCRYGEICVLFGPKEEARLCRTNAETDVDGEKSWL